MSAHRTPEEIREAIDELEFVVRELGAKVCMFGSGVRRLHDKAKGVDPDVARLSQGFDQLGLDSQHDYDPLWRKCRELGIAPAFRRSRWGLATRWMVLCENLSPPSPALGWMTFPIVGQSSSGVRHE